MRIIVYGIIQNQLVRAVIDGLRHLDHQVIERAVSVYRENNREQCDAVVTFGLHTPNQLILQEYRAEGIPVVVIDHGYVKRGDRMFGSDFPLDRYFSISLNGLNGHSDPLPGPMSSARWNTLGVPLQPWREEGEFILVCGQKNNDAAVGSLNTTLWAERTIAELQRLTKRPIIFRPHPLEPSQRRIASVPVSEHQTITEALVNTWAVVAYNSNALVDATCAGKPTFAVGPGSMVEHITNKGLSAMENPRLFTREQWAYDIAWRQYNIDEFRSGLFWQYIMGEIEDVQKSPPPVIHTEVIQPDRTIRPIHVIPNHDDHHIGEGFQEAVDYATHNPEYSTFVSQMKEVFTVPKIEHKPRRRRGRNNVN